MECGACASWITDADRDTPEESPWFDEPTLSFPIDYNNSNASDILSLPWIAPMWNHCNVTALFPASVDIKSTIESVREVLEGVVTSEDAHTSSVAPKTAVPSSTLKEYTIETVPEKDWVLSVQEGWRPLVVANGFLLRFPWHTDDDVSQTLQEYFMQNPSFSPKAYLVPIRLQGGIAFGTGEHATTQLCLEWLHDSVATALSEWNGSTLRVLDYGTGSGILGIAACALGRRYCSPQRNESSKDMVRAVGIDIDVDACRIANANAVMNDDVPMRSFLPPMMLEETMRMDKESRSLLLKALYNQQHPHTRDGAEDDLLLHDELESFDLVVANILAGPLIVLAPTLYTMMDAGARLAMSGILRHQGAAVVQAYQSAGFMHVGVQKELDGWVLVTAERPH
jgi:ribosomal protein L11 methyltransferase